MGAHSSQVTPAKRRMRSIHIKEFQDCVPHATRVIHIYSHTHGSVHRRTPRETRASNPSCTRHARRGASHTPSPAQRRWQRAARSRLPHTARTRRGRRRRGESERRTSHNRGLEFACRAVLTRTVHVTDTHCHPFVTKHRPAHCTHDDTVTTSPAPLSAFMNRHYLRASLPTPLLNSGLVRVRVS